MTSNLGSHIIQQNYENMSAENEVAMLEKTQNQLLELLRKTIRPEFLNRIDEIVLFKPLLQSELKGIIDIQINRVKVMLEEKGLFLQVSDQAREFLLQRGYDVAYGARPMKRTIQKHLINPLSTEILMNKFSTGDTIVVDDAGDGRLHFTKK